MFARIILIITCGTTTGRGSCTIRSTQLHTPRSVFVVLSARKISKWPASDGTRSSLIWPAKLQKQPKPTRAKTPRHEPRASYFALPAPWQCSPGVPRLSNPTRDPRGQSSRARRLHHWTRCSSRCACALVLCIGRWLSHRAAKHFLTTRARNSNQDYYFLNLTADHRQSA